MKLTLKRNREEKARNQSKRKNPTLEAEEEETSFYRRVLTQTHVKHYAIYIDIYMKKGQR